MTEDIREQVREKYAKAIKTKSGCCGAPGCCGGVQSEATKAITGNLYHADEVAGLPEELVKASFGCGNPNALGVLHPGETVLDLGSGAGLDVLLSARRVGPYGKAYGLDMTDEMLAEANANKAKAGMENVQFLKGHIEDIPLPDASVDVVISNCVINLSADKDRVFGEIFRVLRPGGRIAVSDIVTTRPLPDKIRKSLLAWAGCVAGALTDEEYRSKLGRAGFESTEVVVTRVYDLLSPSSQGIVGSLVPEATTAELEELDGSLVSAFIRAKKPARLLTAGEDYILRAARPEDVPAIEGLLATSGLMAVELAPNVAKFLVAECGGIAGVVGAEYGGDAVLLRSLAVRPEERKAGIAAALLGAVLDRARDAGRTRAYLFTHTAAEYFAEKGFRRIAREEVPACFLASTAVTACCDSAVAMVKELT